MIRYLHIEMLKLRKDKAFLGALAGFAGAPAMVTAMFLLGKADLLRRGDYTGQFFALQSMQMLAILMGPMMLAVLGAYLITSEYRQKTLKGLLPLPMSLPGLIATKAVWGVAGIGLGLLVAAAMSVLVPRLLGAAPGDLTYTQLLLVVGEQAGWLLVLFPTQLLFSMVVSLVSKNFVAPLAAAGLSLVGGMLAINSDKARYAWTTLPLMAIASKRMQHDIGLILASGIVYSVLFLAASLLWAHFVRSTGD